MATTYKIGEAAALLNLKTYVLRFWETEFPEVVPLRTEKGQRLYTEADLALLERIRYLLHEQGLTIGGARKALAEEKARGAVYAFDASSASGEAAVQDEFQAPAPVEESEDAFSDEEQNCDPPESEDAPEPCPAWTWGDQTGAKQRPQYNLPGLDQIIALREAFAVEKPESAFENGEEQQPADSHGAKPVQGMLPLFAMVRSAFLAGKAAGASLSGKGGDNFIQTGAGSAETAAFMPGSASAGSPEALRLLAEELEQVACILRTDKPAGSPAGEHSPPVILRKHDS